MRATPFIAAALALLSQVAQADVGFPRFEPYQNGARRPGSDMQHNIGSVVTDPVSSQQMSAQKPQPGYEPEKITRGKGNEKADVAMPRTQRESGIPSIETNLPAKNESKPDARKDLPPRQTDVR